jgi:hypothetical protein
VTARGDDRGVRNGSEPVAVCVVRLEHRRDGLLISLRLTLDVRSTSGEWRVTVGSADEALAVISAFVDRFGEED